MDFEDSTYGQRRLRSQSFQAVQKRDIWYLASEFVPGQAPATFQQGLAKTFVREMKNEISRPTIIFIVHQLVWHNIFLWTVTCMFLKSLKIFYALAIADVAYELCQILTWIQGCSASIFQAEQRPLFPSPTNPYIQNVENLCAVSTGNQDCTLQVSDSSALRKIIFSIWDKHSSA